VITPSGYIQMKIKIIAPFFFLLCSFGILHSQNLNKPKLDSLFNVLSEKNKAMGSVALSKNGKIIYSRAIGYSLISDKEKAFATTNTKYRIGSITKIFTAVMIFQLVEEGKIKLETTLNNYFPKIPNADKITIGNLLNHRSGLYNFTNDSLFGTRFEKSITRDEMLDMISKFKVDFQPNEKAAYSNTNYVLLGYIIENICGKSYKEILDERIVSKIGLANTYYGGKTNVKNSESYSYNFENGKWKQHWETDMSIPGGAGGIISNPIDLTKFMDALFSGKLVSEKSLTLMKTVTDGYGMGIFQMPFYEKKTFGFSGQIDGFSSMLSYFPEDNLSVAYISNGEVSQMMNDILIGVLLIYFNKKYSIPKF
jgi:D-alanyl-D-alanine carboxypeptidase